MIRQQGTLSRSAAGLDKQVAELQTLDHSMREVLSRWNRIDQQLTAGSQALHWKDGELKHLDSARADNKLKLAGLQDLVRGLERSQTEFKEHARQLELELQKSHQVVVSKEARVGELEAQCQRSQDALASSSDALRTLERQSKIEQQLVAKKQARLLEMESQHTRDQKDVSDRDHQ